MPDDLYDHDILAWSEDQAERLRLAAADSDGIDWDHVIQEIAGVGPARLVTVHSLLRRAMLHLIRLHLSPFDTARPVWHAEVRALLDEAEDHYEPTMSMRVDLDRVWIRAQATAAELFGDNERMGGLPARCPWPVETLLSNDVEALLRGFVAMDDDQD